MLRDSFLFPREPGMGRFYKKNVKSFLLCVPHRHTNPGYKAGAGEVNDLEFLFSIYFAL
jgi:hypothetical protein